MDQSFVLANARVEITYFDGSVVNHQLKYDKVVGGLRRYYVESNGIGSRYMGVALMIRPYISIDDEEISGITKNSVYSKCKQYGVLEYTAGRMEKSTDQKLKKTLAALLNYGAAMQAYKGDKAPYMNACLQEYVDNGWLNADYLELGWNDALLNIPESPTPEMCINFPYDGTALDAHDGTVDNIGKSLMLDGAISIKYYKGVGDDYSRFEGSTSKMYFWTEEQYYALKNNGIPLAKDNASYVREYDAFDTKFAYSSKYKYHCTVLSDAFFANCLDNVVYSALVITCADGTEYYSGVEVYGPEVYAYNKLSNNKVETIDDVCRWLVVYGERAKDYLTTK